MTATSWIALVAVLVATLGLGVTIVTILVKLGVRFGRMELSIENIEFKLTENITRTNSAHARATRAEAFSQHGE